MTLEELGYNKKFEAFRIEQKLNDFGIGRIIAEHKENKVPLFNSSISYQQIMSENI